MKLHVGVIQTHVSWFVSVGVFVDLFTVGIDMHRTVTMFVHKNVTDGLCALLVDGGWDCKITIGEDMMKECA